MINTLNVATNGQLRNRNPLQIATLGFISITTVSIFIDNNVIIWSLTKHKYTWSTSTRYSSWTIMPSRTIWTLLEE